MHVLQLHEACFVCGYTHKKLQNGPTSQSVGSEGIHGQGFWKNAALYPPTKHSAYKTIQRLQFVEMNL